MTDAREPLPKWLLGRQLRSLREEGGHSVAEIAKRLGLVGTSVRRFEDGKTVITKLALEVLSDYYEVEPETRERLFNLREMASQPGWWKSYGPQPDATAALLEMEPAAIRIRSFDHDAVPGLLQTPACARAIIDAVELDISRQQLESGVELRVQRQSRVFGDEKREVTFIVDETALHRMPGSAETRRAQLARLRTPPKGVTVRILPFSAGPHPALAGFTIFDFDSDVISRGAYVEWSAMTRGGVEEGNDVLPFEQIWERIKPMTLSPSQSSQFIKRMMEGISDE